MIEEKIYWVKGQGPMKYKQKLEKTLQMVTLSGHHYYAAPEQIGRDRAELTDQIVTDYVEALIERKICAPGTIPEW